VAGEIAQHDLWFPPIELPVGFGQTRTPTQLPVLTMVTGYARWLSAVLIRRGGRKTCSQAGGNYSSRWVRCRGCWSGTASARSADTAATLRADERVPGLPRHPGVKGAGLQAAGPGRPRD
jgi:hypothetical protein